jgi:hypothetical protein
MWKKKKQNQNVGQYVKNKLYHTSFIFFILIGHLAVANNTFTFNSNLLAAQKQNHELRLDRASELLQTELLFDADNSAIYYLLHFNSFVKAFVSEDPTDYAAYQKIQESTLDHLRDMDEGSPYKKFAESEVYFYSASLKAKFNELYGAARDVKRAHSLIEENYKAFPDFLPNNKTRGILKMYLSTVPDNYAWIIGMLGVKGNMSEGIRLLSTLADHQNDADELGGIAREAAYLYSFSLMHVAKQQNKAWVETLKCTNDYRTNLVSCFFRSNMALKLNRNETAMQILNARPTSAEYLPFYVLNFMLGTAKLNKQDPSSLVELEIFVNKFKGKNYLKSATQKLSWYYLLDGNFSKAEFYKSQIDKVGASINEEDKLAIRFSQKQLPNRYLLKTRLLYDGGYYTKASQIISIIEPKELPNNMQKAEYCYRQGGINEKQGRMAAALKFYEACSLYGRDSDEYYGAYASIYLGEYYLSQGDKTNAQKFFERALSFKKNKEYLDSIEYRAKAGLKKTV